MKKIFCSLFVCAVALVCAPTFATGTFSCGDGYVLVAHNKIDGITTMECEKLWCRDLETGKFMGSGKTVANGYRATSEPIELADNAGHSIKCFGDRKWCSGEVAGIWNPEFGGYTRGGDDSATYKSYQKGGCFAWRLEKPNCEAGMTAILQNDEWVCATEAGASSGNRASSIRRTGTIRRQ